MKQWKRKSVFLGIHLHPNYRDILGKARGTRVTQCAAARRTFWTFIKPMTRTTKALTFNNKKRNRLKSKSKLSQFFFFLASFHLIWWILFFSSPPSLPPGLRHQVQLQRWGKGMREAAPWRSVPWGAGRRQPSLTCPPPGSSLAPAGKHKLDVHCSHMQQMI